MADPEAEGAAAGGVRPESCRERRPWYPLLENREKRGTPACGGVSIGRNGGVVLRVETRATRPSEHDSVETFLEERRMEHPCFVMGRKNKAWRRAGQPPWTASYPAILIDSEEGRRGMLAGK